MFHLLYIGLYVTKLNPFCTKTYEFLRNYSFEIKLLNGILIKHDKISLNHNLVTIIKTCFTSKQHYSAEHSKYVKHEALKIKVGLQQ